MWTASKKFLPIMPRIFPLKMVLFFDVFNVGNNSNEKEAQQLID